MKELQTAFSRKEKLSRVLGSLEALKSKNEIAEDQYLKLSDQYKNSLREVDGKIEEIRNRLESQIQKKTGQLNATEKEIDTLEIRGKIGEIGQEVADSKINPLRNKVSQLKQQIRDLKSLKSASTSGDVGGYVEVDIGKSESNLLGRVTQSLNISKVDLSSIRPEGMAGLGPAKSLSVVGGFLLVISVFLPFISVSFFSVSLHGIGSLVGMAGDFSNRFGGPTPTAIDKLLGYLWLIFLLLGIGIIGSAVFLRDLSKGLRVALGILPLVLFVVLFVCLAAQEDIGGISTVLEAASSGFYGLLVGCVLALVGGIIWRKQSA